MHAAAVITAKGESNDQGSEGEATCGPDWGGVEDALSWAEGDAWKVGVSAVVERLR